MVELQDSSRRGIESRQRSQDAQCRELLAKWDEIKPVLGQHAGWVKQLLTFNSPVTDKRLRVERGKPVKIPDYFGALETSSWRYQLSAQLQAEWYAVADYVIDAISKKPTEKISASLDDLVLAESEKLSVNVQEYIRIIQEKTGSTIDPDDILMAGSGAAAIVLGRNVLGKDGELAATTQENGSGVTKGLSVGENLFEIILRDPKTNKPYSDDEVLAQWKNCIDSGAQCLSITAMSKTGLRYDQQDRVIDRVLEYVKKYNADNGADIVVIIDAVQLGGRDDFSQVTKWLQDDRVDAVAHSGSKAFGGTAHAGFLLLSKSGKQRAGQSIQLSHGDDIIHWIQDLEVSYAPMLSQKKGTEPIQRMNLLSVMRGTDNVRAVSEQVALPTDEQLYGENAKEMVVVIQTFFEMLGYKLLLTEDYKCSIVAFEPPDLFSPLVVQQVLIPQLSSYGIELGGYLQEPQAGTPILRASVNAQWLKDGCTVSDVTSSFFGDLEFDEIKAWYLKYSLQNRVQKKIMLTQLANGMLGLNENDDQPRNVGLLANAAAAMVQTLEIAKQSKGKERHLIPFTSVTSFPYMYRGALLHIDMSVSVGRAVDAVTEEEGKQAITDTEADPAKEWTMVVTLPDERVLRISSWGENKVKIGNQPESSEDLIAILYSRFKNYFDRFPTKDIFASVYHSDLKRVAIESVNAVLTT